MRRGGAVLSATTDAETIRSALRRACTRTALVHFLFTTPGGYDVYAVGSSEDVDTAYRVTVLDGVYRCTCPSENRPACWHRAAVYARRMNERAWAEQEAV